MQGHLYCTASYSQGMKNINHSTLSGVLYKQHPWNHWVPQSFPLTVTTSHAHGAFLVAQQWRICLQCGRPSFSPWVGKIPWRREWLPVPVFLPGGFHGQRSLAGYRPWGHKESETTEPLSFSAHGSHRVRNPHGCGKNSPMDWSTSQQICHFISRVYLYWSIVEVQHDVSFSWTA